MLKLALQDVLRHRYRDPSYLIESVLQVDAELQCLHGDPCTAMVAMSELKCLWLKFNLAVESLCLHRGSKPGGPCCVPTWVVLKTPSR